MKKDDKKPKVWDKLTIFIVLGIVAVFTFHRMNLEHGVYDEKIDKITHRPKAIYILATGLIREKENLSLETHFVDFENLKKIGKRGSEYTFYGHYTKTDGAVISFNVTATMDDEVRLISFSEDIKRTEKPSRDITLTNYRGIVLESTIVGRSESYLFFNLQNSKSVAVYPVELLSPNSIDDIKSVPIDRNDALSEEDQMKIYQLYKEYYAVHGIDPYKKVNEYYSKHSGAPRDPFAP